MATFRSGKIWGLDDLSDVGSTLGVAFAASLNNGPRFAITVDGPTDLVCTATVSGVAATAVEFRLDVSTGGPDDFRPLPPEFLSIHPNPVSGVLGGYTLIIHVPWSCEARLMARRVNGTAGTLLDVQGEARDASEGSLLETISAGASSAGVPFISRPALIVTAAYVYGFAFEAGDATYLSILVAKTLGLNPTTVEFDIQSSVDAGVTWRTLPQIDQVAAGDTIEQAMTLVTAEIGAAVGDFEYGTEILPGRLYQVGVLATGPLPTLAIDLQLISR